MPTHVRIFCSLFSVLSQAENICCFGINLTYDFSGRHRSHAAGGGRDAPGEKSMHVCFLPLGILLPLRIPCRAQNMEMFRQDNFKIQKTQKEHFCRPFAQAFATVESALSVRTLGNRFTSKYSRGRNNYWEALHRVQDGRVGEGPEQNLANSDCGWLSGEERAKLEQKCLGQRVGSGGGDRHVVRQ